MSTRIRYYWQLDVYKLSVEAAMEIFAASKKFPREEMYNRIVGKLVKMENNPSPWLFPGKTEPR